MKILVELTKTSDRVVRVSLSKYKGARRLDIREWYWRDGDFHPTRNGVSIHSGVLRPLRDAFDLGLRHEKRARRRAQGKQRGSNQS
jgi:hypothetical protein